MRSAAPKALSINLLGAFFVSLALSISCKKKNEEVKPVENCRFVGKSVYTISYKYDSKGSVQTATGGGSVVNYTDGIRTSEVLSDSKIVIKYDDLGRMTSYSSPFDQRVLKYDQRGNQIFHESYDSGEFVFSTETKFDKHPNPDNMIPSRYKGIPDPIKIPYVDDNPNNMTENIFNHRNDAPVTTSNVLTYHPNGLPATSILKTGTDFDKTTSIIKFKYENCD